MKVERDIRNLIRHTGAIGIDSLMAATVPYYYNNHKAFGKEGDFTTAPNISQMFGEIIGIWCANMWMNVGSPKFRLAELGPGNGILMADLLRATRHVDGFHESLQEIVLVETSARLRQEQSSTLARHNSICRWQDNLDGLDSYFTIVIANEFLDALPIRQFVARSGKLQEIVITLNGKQLEFALSPVVIPTLLSYPDGAVIEASSAVKSWANLIAKVLLQKTGGVSLIIDYGYTSPPYKSTLQAVKEHKHYDVLADIGSADITAHVDFTALKKTFEDNGLTTRYHTQGEFLKNHGIEERAKSLIAHGANEPNILTALGRLTSPKEMGSLFKVMEIGLQLP